MSKKEPRILEGVVLLAADRKRLAPVMSNWLKVHAHMSKLKRNVAGYEELRKMLKYELQNAKREDVMKRLFQRATLVQMRLTEMKELLRAAL